MEFTIRALIVIMLAVIAFVVFVALISTWGGESSGMLKGLNEWFGQVLSGGIKPPSGNEVIPGIGGGSP
jgi:hypothetical protein